MKNKIEQENNEMLRNQIKEAQHHSSELKSVVSSNTQVEPWVVAKMERATTDLSDIAHYLDGRKDIMKQGGLTPSQEEKVAKVMHEFKEGELHSGSKQGPVVTNRKQAIAIALAEANAMKMKQGGSVPTFKSRKLAELKEWKKEKLESIKYLANRIGINNKNSSYIQAEKKLDELVEDCTKIIKSGILKDREYFYRKTFNITTYKGSLETECYLTLNKEIAYSHPKFEKDFEEFNKKYPYSTKSTFAKEFIGRLTIPILGYKLCDYTTLGFDKGDSVGGFRKNSFARGGSMYKDGGNIQPGMMAWKENKSYTVVRFDDELQRWVLQSTTSGLEIMPKESELSEYEFQQSGNSKMKDGGSVNKNMPLAKKGDKVIVYDTITGIITNVLKTQHGAMSYKWKSDSAPNDDQFRLFDYQYNKTWKLLNDKMKDGGNLTYGEAQELGDKMRFIKNHIQKKYPQLYYGQQDNILGKAGRDIPATSIAKLKKLAKEKNDLILQKALTNLNAKMKDGGEIKDETIYKVAGRTVTLNKGSKSDGTDWTVTFMNGQIKPLSDVLALIKPFPKGIQKMKDGGNVEGDLTKLSNLEKYVNAHKAEIKANRKTYGFMSVAKITNPYDFSSLLGVDSRIFRNAEIPYYAKFVASLLK